MRHLTECLPDCDGWPCRCPLSRRRHRVPLGDLHGRVGVREAITEAARLALLEHAAAD